MTFSQPVNQIIQRRYSCRQYLETPIGDEQQQRLAEVAASCTAGPLGTSMRFMLVAATGEERSELRGLGTYGTLRSPAGFLIGVVSRGDRNLEQWAYHMERIVLVATDLGLGTCWLGGFFTRSSFSRRIRPGRGEELPAVVATGNPAPPLGDRDLMRRIARSDARLPWERMFFDGGFGAPLSRQAAGAYAEPLEMVRLGPSASNKQPWRVVRDGSRWHFYLQRTPGYYPRRLAHLVVGLSDVQRLDIGIAMCHFELSAVEAGQRGAWQVSDPGLPAPEGQEYTVTWA